MEDGTKFAVGTGFSDAERESPPPLGSLITFRYQELSEAGVPRFPSFVGVREIQTSPTTKKEEIIMPTTAAIAGTRRFEFVGGSSSKFWEISVQGTEVTVRFGRIGSQGQGNGKSFPDKAAAMKHAEKLIREKTGKGYQEVS
jgi:DNA ligase-1